MLLAEYEHDELQPSYNILQIKARYYPLATEAIKHASGATRVIVFDHTLRNGKIK